MQYRKYIYTRFNTDVRACFNTDRRQRRCEWFFFFIINIIYCIYYINIMYYYFRIIFLSLLGYTHTDGI